MQRSDTLSWLPPLPSQAPYLRSATVNLAPSSYMALRAIHRIGSLLLSDMSSHADLASQIARIEDALSLHAAALHIALNAPNATVNTVQRALEDDRSSAEEAGSHIPALASSAADGGAPTTSSVNEALRSHNHKALGAFLKGLDLETSAGIIRAIGEAFNGTMLLPARILFNATPLGDPLSKRDEALARLNDLRTHLTSFLEHSIRLDPNSGVERPSLKYYRLTDDTGDPSPFATAFCELSLDKVPWIDAPYGLLGYLHRLNSNERAAALPEADHYCIPSVMEDLADFAQIPFSAIGMPATVDVADGYSMAGFCRFYAKHLKLAGRLESKEEQLKWLQTSTTHWHTAMTLAGSSMRALIFSSNVASLNLSSFQCPRRPGAPAAAPAFFTADRPLVRADSPPVVALLKMQTALEAAKALKASTDIYGSGAGDSSSVAYEDVQLPRLSSLKRPATGRDVQDRRGKLRATSPQPAVKTKPQDKDDGRDQRGRQPIAPGALVDTWRYTNGGKTLIISGRAWNVPAVAKHLGVKVTSICWPYALCRASNDVARAARCDKHGQPNHVAHGRGAHIPVDTEQLERFSRDATEEEKRGLRSLSRQPGKGKGQGQKRKGKGRGAPSSRGRGRGGFLDYDDEHEPYDSEYDDLDDLDEHDADGAALLALTHRGAGRQGDGLAQAASPHFPAPAHRFVLLGRDLCSFRAGKTETPAAPIDKLPTASAPASAATQRNALHSPMRTLAAHVQSENRLLVDVGGRGQCGPNTLSFEIGLLDSVLHLGAPDGPTLRSACCKHILDAAVQRRLTSLTDEYGYPMMLGPLVINCMLGWPLDPTQHVEASVENWCKMISKPETWTDIAFLQIVSDMCEVAIHVTGVSDLSEILPDMLLILPCDKKPPKALLRVGYWLDRHLVAIVDLSPEKGAAPADLPDGGPDDGADRAAASSDMLSEFEAQLALLHDRNAPPPPPSPIPPAGASAAQLPLATAADVATEVSAPVTEAAAEAVAATGEDACACAGSPGSAAADAAAVSASHSLRLSPIAPLLAETLVRDEACKAAQASLHRAAPTDMLTEQQALDEDWGPPLAEADPLLAGLLRDMAVTAKSHPPSVTSSSLRPSRIRRVGFAEQVDAARPPGEPLDVMARTFTRPDELAAYIKTAADPPTELIGFEFSGAVLLARRAHGVVAITADVRPAEHDGLHYLGCVQDIIHVRFWDRAYMFPPCFQHLLGDSDCLPHKLRDGRAFWAGALVLWCICITSAYAVLVEQPDTLLHHVLDVSLYPNVDVVETTTAALGDIDRKFLRLTMRNFSNLAVSDYDPPPLPRPRQYRYRDPDMRDRARSSWRRFPASSAALARLDASCDLPTPLQYEHVVADFAVRWHAAGFPVPADYLNPDARPSSQSDRRYQSRRGPGDGRQVDAVVPADRHQLAIAAGMLSYLVSHSEEAMPPTPTNVLLLPTTAFLGHAYGAGEWLHQSPPPIDEIVTEADLDSYEIDPTVSEHEPTSTQDGITYVDLRKATEATACILFISVLVQPLILAHANGFTVHGAILPAATRSTAMTAMQKIVDACCSAAAYIAYMVGLYVGGARVFAAPVDFRPPAEAICHTPAQRVARGSAGVAFVWCTLAALAGTPVHDAAQRAVTSAASLIRPVEQLADYPSTEGAVFKTGVSSATSVLRRPILDDPASPKAWQTTAHLHAADQLLSQAIQLALAEGETCMEGWVEQIRPLPLEEVPDQLLHALPEYRDDRLGVIPFAPVLEPLRTPWYPLPPRQPAPPPEAPACVRSVWELYSPRGRETAQAWFTSARDDMLHIRDRLALGAPPAEISRDRPAAAALGQDLETEPWAQGLVWDCTFTESECCVVADFHAPIVSHLNLTYLHSRLRHYPDQTLVANVIEGVRLDADTELQNVLVPHLASLPLGYASVEKELRRLHGLGWYSFHSAPPYYPMYFNGQGAVPRKLEPDRFRRSTEGGGPRRPTYDASGLQAISINEASHVHHMPRHFLADARPEFREWLTRRGLPAARDVHADDGERASKWPKERKPTLTAVARSLSLLCAAAAFISSTHASPVATYVVGDDFRDHFNQLAMAPSELHKLGVVFLARTATEARDASAPAPGADPTATDDFKNLFYQQTWLGGQEPLNFISEKRLGFGTHGASNIAQRFSDALLDLFREDMDLLDFPFISSSRGAERQWLEQRLELQRRKGEPCTDVRRHTAPPTSRLPDIPAPTRLEDIPEGYVCPQLRLYASFCYTDDPLHLVVGVERTLRLLRAWRNLTTRAGLLMAIPEKRSLGSWGQWLGVMIVGTLGILVVPRAKLLRAREAICQALHGIIEFHAYRSLCGLLEHLRAVVLKGRHVMHGLYRPHGPDGAARYGPNGVVDVDDLMRKQLQRWLELLAQAGGVAAKRALLREDLDPVIEWHIDASSDACLAEVLRAGIGGFCHGLFWYVEVPEEDRQLFAIPTLEFLGVAFNILFLHTLLLPSLTEARGAVMVNLRTDALTTSLTLPSESMSSPALVAAYQALLETAAWRELSPYLRVAHAYDHTNTGADLVSRAKWRELYRFCQQLGLRPSWRAVPAEAGLLYAAARLRPRSPPVKYIYGVESLQYMPPYLARLLAAAASAEEAASPHLPPPPPASSALLKRLRAAAGDDEPRPSPRTAPGLVPSAALHPTLTNGAPAHSSLLSRLQGERAEYRDLHSASAPLTAAVLQGSASLPMPMPVTPEPSQSPSRLTQASRHYARTRALALTQGDDPDMALRTSISHALLSTADSVEAYLEFGVNHSTAKKDERAWEMWEVVCGMLGTSPMRTAQDARVRPERNAHLLAVLMFHAVSVCKPRVAGRRWIKPNSALAYPLAIIRIFSRWSIPMPGYKMLKAAAAGLARDYVRYHGPHTLSPVRAEPMKFSMVRAMCAIPTDGRTIARFAWADTCHEVFVFRRLIRVLMVSGLRLGEIVGNGSGEVTYVTFDCVAWRINGILVKNPTAAQLNSMVPGRDAALVSPPRAKPDPWGEIHCPFPMVFTFDDRDPINAAAAIRDIELRYGLACARRDLTPLFATSEGKTYTHHYLHQLLRDVLAYLYDARIASVYSFHSFRSGLATALHAAGVEDSMIMLICRWMCPESLHAYRRMGTAEHERLIAQASTVRVDSIQSGNVATVSGCERYAEVMQHVSAGPRETQRAYAAAASGADDDASAEGPPQQMPQLPLQLSPPRRAHAAPPLETRTPPRLGTTPLTERPRAGDPVLVPSNLWPQYRCKENEGHGWSATVKSVTTVTALVRFTTATTRAGEPYADVRLPWGKLHQP